MKHLGSAKSGPKDCDDLLGGLGVGWGGVGMDGWSYCGKEFSLKKLSLSLSQRESTRVCESSAAFFFGPSARPFWRRGVPATSGRTRLRPPRWRRPNPPSPSNIQAPGETQKGRETKKETKRDGGRERKRKKSSEKQTFDGKECAAVATSSTAPPTLFDPVSYSLSLSPSRFNALLLPFFLVSFFFFRFARGLLGHVRHLNAQWNPAFSSWFSTSRIQWKRNP